MLFLSYGIISCLSFSPSRATFDFGEYPEIGKKSMAAWKNLDFNRGNMEQNLGWADRSLVNQSHPLSMFHIYNVILDM